MPRQKPQSTLIALLCIFLGAEVIAPRDILAFPEELFHPPVSFSADGNLRGVGAADLDADGDIDIFTTSEFSDRVSVFLNDGAAVFSFSAGYPVGVDPWAAVASDFNGDSKPDLAVADNGSTYSNASDSVSILPGNGDGTFGAATGYLLPANSSPRDLVAADLDGDGDADLAIATHGRLGDHATDHFVTVLMNEGGGVFGAPVQYDLISLGNPNGTGPVRIYAHDLDGDGDEDLVTRNLGSDDLSVLLGNGDGTFSAGAHYAYAGLMCVAMYGAAFSDFDEDGDLDAVVGCNYSSSGGSGILFIPGNGDGTFPGSFDPSLVAFGLDLGNAPVSLVHGDFDGDGHLDVVTANWNSSNISVIYGNGDGTFVQAGDEPPTGLAPSEVAAADFDGDGLLDVSAVNFGAPSVLDVFLNGAAQTEPPSPPLVVPALSLGGLFFAAVFSILWIARRRVWGQA